MIVADLPEAARAVPDTGQLNSPVVIAVAVAAHPIPSEPVPAIAATQVQPVMTVESDDTALTV